MIHFIRLSGRKTGRPCFVQVEAVAAVFDHAEIKGCTVVALTGGVTVHVAETPEEIIAALKVYPSPVDPPEPA